MPKRTFFDLKTRKKFETDDFETFEKVTSRGTVRFASTTAPSGVRATTIIGKTK